MRAALIYQHATDERAREIADRLNELVERQIKAMTEGTPDDDDGAAGLLVPTGLGTWRARRSKPAPARRRPLASESLRLGAIRVWSG
jgi:hypothetical protein